MTPRIPDSLSKLWMKTAEEDFLWFFLWPNELMFSLDCEKSLPRNRNGVSLTSPKVFPAQNSGIEHASGDIRHVIGLLFPLFYVIFLPFPFMLF